METQQTTQEQTKYFSCAETAKYVRVALKKAFPNQKFSVRSHVYSGGASIDVSWDNGVSTDKVNEVIKQFEGAGFDGMIDLKYYKDHWLLPNGEVVLARSEGTQGSNGYYPAVNTNKPHPEAIKVSWGADYVFAHREISKDILEKVAKTLAKNYDIEFNSMDEQVKDGFLTQDLYDTWWGVARRIVWEKDLTNFKDIKPTKLETGQLPDFWEVVQEDK